MRVYFSGIGGVGIGPLAQIAVKAGYEIAGSDLESSMTTRALINSGVQHIKVGAQTDDYLRQLHSEASFDYFVYTAALSADHPELLAAHELGITCLKRDGLLARIISDCSLDMIAVAGTHGKTSTTGLMVWVMKQLGQPISYSVGSTLTFGPSGDYSGDSKLFIYECDEYDRNFLHFTPAISVITSIDYDHPDTYPTLEDYQSAFGSFLDQSETSMIWKKDLSELGTPEIASELIVFLDSINLEHIKLAGHHMRQNAFLVERTVMRLFPDTDYHQLISAINSYPGSDRRMEQLSENLYSDYGHHPREIKATLQLASELNDQVVLVYQPHQNSRQHLIRHEYKDTFTLAKKVYWLPTYLSRENPELEIISPENLAAEVSTVQDVEFAEMNHTLVDDINRELAAGKLVLCMGAGSIDTWIRQQDSL